MSKKGINSVAIDAKVVYMRLYGTLPSARKRNIWHKIYENSIYLYRRLWMSIDTILCFLWEVSGVIEMVKVDASKVKWSNICPSNRNQQTSVNQPLIRSRDYYHLPYATGKPEKLYTNLLKAQTMLRQNLTARLPAALRSTRVCFSKPLTINALNQFRRDVSTRATVSKPATTRVMTAAILTSMSLSYLYATKLNALEPEGE